MQKIYPLSSEMARGIEAKRTWVRDHYTSEMKSKYETIDGKLHLLDVILKSSWIEKDETLKFQCLGITLGDVFIQDLNLKWIEVQDEFGNDPALQVIGTSIIIYPMTMISKRIEQGEDINIYELYAGLRKKIVALKASGV